MEEDMLASLQMDAADAVKACWWVRSVDGHQAGELDVEGSLGRLLDILRASDNLCADISICIKEKRPEACAVYSADDLENEN